VTTVCHLGTVKGKLLAQDSLHTGPRSQEKRDAKRGAKPEGKLTMKYLTIDGPGDRTQDKRRERVAWAIWGLVLLGLTLAAWLAATGCASAPTAVERRLYVVSTNPFPVSVTSVVGSNGTEYVTNYAPAYSFQPAPATQQILGLGGLFGPTGELIAAIIAAGLVAWAGYRQRATRKLAKVLVQNIATGRAALQHTAEGRALDERWRDDMISEQDRAGVLPAATELVRRCVDEPKAQLAARRYLTRTA
jgi:hypothetical protein